jgi:hypothetical protein
MAAIGAPWWCPKPLPACAPLRGTSGFTPRWAKKMHTDEVHALSMKTFTPAEWAAQAQ